MTDQELIRLYRDLTASDEGLARSVTLFVESSLLTELTDLDVPAADSQPRPTRAAPIAEGTQPPPGAED
jgi:hypothetical protein